MGHRRSVDLVFKDGSLRTEYDRPYSRSLEDFFSSCSLSARAILDKGRNREEENYESPFTGLMDRAAESHFRISRRRGEYSFHLGPGGQGGCYEVDEDDVRARFPTDERWGLTPERIMAKAEELGMIVLGSDVAGKLRFLVFREYWRGNKSNWNHHFANNRIHVIKVPEPKAGREE